MAVDGGENVLGLFCDAFAGGLVRHDTREINGVAVHDDLAHARSGFETLNAHWVLRIYGEPYLARRNDGGQWRNLKENPLEKLMDQVGAVGVMVFGKSCGVHDRRRRWHDRTGN